jgi:hypothetical protein
MSTTTNSASTAQAEPDVGELLDSIRLMQGMGCDAFDQIRGLVRCALYALETPEGVIDVATMASVLASINHIAEDADSILYSEGSGHGIERDLASWSRRFEAQSKAKQITARLELERVLLQRTNQAEVNHG